MRKAIGDFRALSPVRQAALVGLAACQLWLLVTSQLDIQRRPASDVRGSKAMWRLICLINTIGPLAYFRWGRRSAGM